MEFKPAFIKKNALAKLDSEPTDLNWLDFLKWCKKYKSNSANRLVILSRILQEGGSLWFQFVVGFCNE